MFEPDFWTMECFSRFLNCTKCTKLRNTPQIQSRIRFDADYFQKKCMHLLTILFTVDQKIYYVNKI